MRHPNWSGYASESASEAAQEAQETDRETLAAENAYWEDLKDAEREGFDSDDPVCEWCWEVVPDGESAYAPYCSAECEQEATRETYASVHPRPEEVG